MQASSNKKMKKIKRKPPSFGIYANERVDIGFVIESVDVPAFEDEVDNTAIGSKKIEEVDRRRRGPRGTKNAKRTEKNNSKIVTVASPGSTARPPQSRTAVSKKSSPEGKKKVEFDTISRKSERSFDEDENDVGGFNGNDNDNDNDNINDETNDSSSSKKKLQDNRCLPSTRKDYSGSLPRRARPKSGRRARHADHPFNNWNINSSPVDRDLLTIENDTKFTASRRWKNTAATPNSASSTPDALREETRRRPQSKNNRKSSIKTKPEKHVHQNPWNSAAELDESRHTGPKMRPTPKINSTIAVESAEHERQHWKPVNQHWFSTKTALGQLWPRPEGWH